MLVGGGSVAGRFERLVEDWELELRAGARGLPHRLGLVAEETGTWDDYTGVRLANDMPGVVLPDVEERIDGGELEGYRRLHLCVATHFLIADRVADGDVPGGGDLDALAERFLAAAVDPRPRGGRFPLREGWAAMRADWEAAVEAERRSIRAGGWELREYGRTIRGKNRYLRFAAAIHPRVEGDPLLVSCLEGLLVALQCRSDAVDAEDDRRRRGVGFPDLAGLSDEVLHGAAIAMMGVLHGWARRRNLRSLAVAIGECFARDRPLLEAGSRERSEASMVALCLFPELAKFV